MIASEYVIDYKIVSYDEAKGFSEMVNDALKQGWRLWGQPFSMGNRFCQGLIKLAK